MTTPSPRAFDIIVYGATGYTGKRVVQHLLRKHPNIPIAISGRNASKLNDVATELGGAISPNQILVASADDISALTNALSQARIVLACAGPYRHVGKNIVQAAIEAKTDYLDLCGEPQFFDDMLVQFDQKARDNNTLVLSACAFDCVPAELSYKLASKELKNKYPNSPVSNVEIVHTFDNIACGNATTFHAAVDGFHSAYTGELKESRERVKQAFPSFTKPKRPEDWNKMIVSPGTSSVYHEHTDKHVLKFMGADASCILASDRYLRLRELDNNEEESSSSNKTPTPPPPHLSVCFGLDSKSSTFKFLTFGAVFTTLARFSWGCKVLHSNPELFTNGFFRENGPTDEELSKGTFVTHGTAFGATKDECVRITCSGGEPGYVATPAMIVALARTVLNFRDKIRFDGGVMLPGAAFGDVEECFEMLSEEGVTFAVVDDAQKDEENRVNENKV